MRESDKRRFVSIIKRSLCFMLCLFLFPIIACDSKKSSSKSQTFSVSDYTSETYPEEQAYFAPTELSYSSFSEDQTVNALAMTVCGDTLAVLARSNASDGMHFETQMCFFDQTGTEIGSFCFETMLKQQDVTVSYIAGTKNRITAFVTFLDENSLTITKELCFFDLSGNELRDAYPLSSSDETFSPTGLKVLASGETVVEGVNSEGNVFYVYGTDMCLLYIISGDQLTGEMLESDENLYVMGQESSKGVQKTYLYRVNMETGVLSEALDVTELLGTGLRFSNSGNLYLEDTTSLYSIGLSSTTITTLLDWSDLDINRSEYSYVSPICVLSDDVVCILGTSDYVSKVVMLIRQDQNPNLGKETIVLSGLDISATTSLLETVDAFNKSSDDYRVEIVDYMQPGEDDYEAACQQMYLDVYTGNGPDIIYGKYSLYIKMNSFASYEANDLLLDMYPLMESDPDFDIDDYLPNVIEACTVDGELCKIPIHFGLYGIIADSSLTNGITGWTPTEFDQIAATLPNDMQMIAYQTQLDLLKTTLAGTMNDYIDEDTGEVSFNTDEFYDILELAKTYGVSEALFENTDISQTACVPYGPIIGTFDFSDSYLTTFEETPDIIGYPSAEKMSSYIYPEEEVAISSWSDCPEGAWAFVKYLLSEEYQTEYSYDYTQAYATQEGSGFPIRTDSLQAIIDLAMDPPDIEVESDDMPPVEVIFTQEQADACLSTIYQSDTLYYLDLDIYAIIEEEVQAFFQDQKSVEDVSALIQDRVQTLMNERG